MYVSEGVSAHATVFVCKFQLCEVSSLQLLCRSPSLHSKHFYLLSHLPNTLDLFIYILSDLLYVYMSVLLA